MMPEVGRIVSQPVVQWEGGTHGRWRMKPTGKHGPLSENLFKDGSCDVGHVTGCLYLLDRIPKDAMRFPNVPIYEDLLFNMGLIAAGVTLFIAIRPVYNYFRHKESLTFGTFTIEDANKVIDAYNEIILKYTPSGDTIARFDAFLDNIMHARLGDKYEEL